MDEIERIKKEKMEKFLEKTPEIEIDVNDSNFEEKVIGQSEKIPVVVDFWSQRCMPCLILSPVLEKLAGEYSGKFVLAKLNVDEGFVTAQEYRIMSIPAVKMFKKGKVVDEFVGAAPEQNVRQWLDKNLGD